MSHRNNLGPDPSQWSSGKMTGVGLSIAGTVAGAMTFVLANLLDRGRRPTRYVSAKAVRLTDEAADAALISLADLLLQHAHGERDAAMTRAAEAEADLAQERLYRSKDHK